MIIFNFPSPPTGALSVPVVNCKNSLFCSSVNEWTISQNSLSKNKSRSKTVNFVICKLFVINKNFQSKDPKIFVIEQ